MKKPIFLDSKYLQWTQSIFTTNFSTDCSQKKMHCAQLQADKKEFVSKCQSFQYFLALFTRIRFFCYEKIEMAKDIYRIVASRSTSRLVTCLGLFRLLMKGIFGPYVLWPLDKKLIFWIATRVSARDYTVYDDMRYLIAFSIFKWK